MSNIPSAQPQLLDVLLRNKRETSLEINCVKIGKIESYSNLTNTAKITISSLRRLPNGDTCEYPQLEDCPVFILQGGGSYLSMPIDSGDNCLVLFNDRCIDDWYVSGQITAPDDTRVHSLADGIAIVGINPLTDVIPHSSSVTVLNGGTHKVAIKNATTDLKTLMGSLVDNVVSLLDLVNGMTVITSAPGGTWPIDPATQASLATLKTTFTGYKTTLATLLDEGTL
jgi:hypothetical protein